MPLGKKRDNEGEPLRAPDFQLLFEAMPDPCFVLSPARRLLAANSAFLLAMQTDREAIVGEDVFKVLPEFEKHRDTLERVLDGGGSGVMELQRPDTEQSRAAEEGPGERVWRMSATPVFGRNKDLCYIILNAHEVSKYASYRPRETPQQDGLASRQSPDINLLLKSANEQLAVQNAKLRESEQRFAAFMAHLPAIAWIKDLDGTYVYVNPEAERVFPEIPHDSKCTDFDLFPPETARHFRESDDRVLVEGSVQTTEVFRHRDGNEHCAVVTKFALAGPDGQPAYVAGLGFDVTERVQAEKALRESGELFHAIFNLAAVGIAQVTPDGKLLLINQKMCETVGYTVEELLQLTAYDISHPEDIVPHLAMLRRLLDGEIADYKIEKRLVHKNGSSVWVHLTVTLVRDQSGQPEYLIAIVQDINERKRAEEALRESEEKFYKIFNLAPIGIGITTLEEGRIIEMNEAAERLSGYSRKEVVGHLVSEFRAWKDSSSRRLIVREILQNGEIRERELEFLSKPGRLFWGSFSGVVFEIRGVKHLLTLISDVSERRKAQEALRVSEERFRLLAETVPVMIWEAGPDGHCTFLNRRWVEYTGRELEPGEGGLLNGWTQGIHPDDLDGCVSSFISALKERGDFSVEYRLRRSDGDYGWIVNTAVPRLAPDGELLGYIGTCFDITERKRAREALQQDKELLAQRVAERTAELKETIDKLHEEIGERIRVAQALQAETAERLSVQAELREKELLLLHQSRLAAMGEMIGNIAHQWRQPLNLLGLLVQDLPITYKIGKLDAEYLTDIVKKMLEAIRHMSQTISDFRNFFSPDKEMVHFRVLETVNRTLSLMEGTLKAADIETTVIADSDPVINGFPNEFAQVILNIISNAKDEFVLRKVPEPAITIQIGAEDGRSLVTITDNAGGIPEEVIDKIFDPYFTTKGPEKGTGVGLYMSKTIIEKNMGGILQVRNVPGGAQFRILL